MHRRIPQSLPDQLRCYNELIMADFNYISHKQLERIGDNFIIP